MFSKKDWNIPVLDIKDANFKEALRRSGLLTTNPPPYWVPKKIKISQIYTGKINLDICAKGTNI